MAFSHNLESVKDCVLNYHGHVSLLSVVSPPRGLAMLLMLQRVRLHASYPAAAVKRPPSTCFHMAVLFTGEIYIKVQQLISFNSRHIPSFLPSIATTDSDSGVFSHMTAELERHRVTFISRCCSFSVCKRSLCLSDDVCVQGGRNTT